MVYLIQFRFTYYLIVFLLDYYLAKIKKLDSYDWNEVGSNLFTYALGIFFGTYFSSEFYAAYKFAYAFRIFYFSQSSILTYIACFVLVDFTFYWIHRYMHSCALGWASHFNHHSPTKMNITVSVRTGVIKVFSLIWVFNLPLMIIGFSPDVVLNCYFVNFVYQVPSHAAVPWKFKFIDWIFVTPAQHRVHHSSEYKYFNSNFAGVFILFDRIFGTYQSEDEVTVTTLGIPKYMKMNYFNQAFHFWGDLAKAIWIEKNYFKKFLILFEKPYKLKIK